MRCILLFLVALLKIGSLKTESIDFARKNGRMDMIYPLIGQNKAKDVTLHSAESHIGSGEQREWNVADLKYQPNDLPFRKIISLDDNDEYENEDIEIPEGQFKSLDQLDEAQLARFSNYLIKLLQRPGVWEAPLILVKDNGQDNFEDRPFPLELDGIQNIAKRSRYYRPYPWKRENSRSYSNMDYDPYNPCNPTRHDVFQLLVALHDARQGNKSRYVNFCNRRRPASAVYTNIRFLGRRK